MDAGTLMSKRIQNYLITAKKVMANATSEFRRCDLRTYGLSTLNFFFYSYTLMFKHIYIFTGKSIPK